MPEFLILIQCNEEEEVKRRSGIQNQYFSIKNFTSWPASLYVICVAAASFTSETQKTDGFSHVCLLGLTFGKICNLNASLFCSQLGCGTFSAAHKSFEFLFSGTFTPCATVVPSLCKNTTRPLVSPLKNDLKKLNKSCLACIPTWRPQLETVNVKKGSFAC